VSKGLRIKIRGEQYAAVVLKVVEKDVHGRPSRVDIVHDDQSTPIEGGEEFIVAWWPAIFSKKTLAS